MNTSYHRTHGTIGSDYIRYRYIYDRHPLNCRSPGHLIVIWKTEIKPPLMFTNWWIFCHINLLWWSTSFHHVHANLLHYFTYAVDLFFDNNCIKFTCLSEIRTRNVIVVIGTDCIHCIAHKSILPYDHDHDGPQWTQSQEVGCTT